MKSGKQKAEIKTRVVHKMNFYFLLSPFCFIKNEQRT